MTTEGAETAYQVARAPAWAARKKALDEAELAYQKAKAEAEALAAIWEARKGGKNA